MVCWTLTTLIFWINSVHSELGTGMNYASEFLFLGFQTMFPGSRTVVTSTQIFSNRSWGHSCSYSASYLQCTQGFVIKIFKVITPSLQVGLVFLLYQWLMIHMSLPLWLFLFFDFSHFIMNTALSNTSSSKEKFLAIHLLAIYKSSSSQLSFCHP